jgi:hypothetical protein
MSKNTNLSFLADFLTADIVNTRVGINNVSPQATLDVVGTGKFSGVLTLGSTVSNGTYTYTLPSATGTLALTSQIPSVSGYVPYTGANQNLDLGTNDITSRYVVAAGSAGLGGVISIRQDATYLPKGNGYSSIASSFTAFDFYGYTGASTYKNFSFRFDGLTNSTLRTYTLPDADGTIALTSAIPANPVGGTGTTNYLAKFTGSTTIGNSQIIDNGTQVGIGLTPNTSYGTLQIKSPASVYSIDLVGRTAGVNSENQITFWNAAQSVGLAYIYNSLSNLYIGTGANQPFTLSSGGNFIFGSTSDNGGKFQVSGDIQSSSFIRSNTPKTNSVTIGVSANANYGYIGNDNLWGIRTGTAGDFNIDVNNSTSPINALKISQTGNVGIGVTPAVKFQVNDGTNINLGIKVGQTDSTAVMLNAYNDAVSANIPLEFRASKFAFQNGNVGIGTATINNERLTVAQTTGNASALFVYTTGVAAGQSYGATIVGGTNASDASFRVFNQGASINYFTVRGDGAATFSSSVTADAKIVSMQSNPALDAIIAAHNSANTGMEMRYFPNNAQGFIDNTYPVTAGQVYGDIYFRQNVSGTMNSRMFIQARSGNVGIGSTNPFARLQVTDSNTNEGTIAIGNNTFPGLIFSSAGTGEFRIDNRSSSGGGYISFYPNGQATTLGNEAMRVSTSRNLLIGTTTDTGAKLNVGGSYQSYPVSIEAMAGGGQLALTRSGAVAEIYMGGGSGGATQLYVRSGGSGGVRLDAGSTAWVSASDIRLKDIEKPIEKAVESLSSLQTIYYSWKDSIDKSLHIGLIAQEVEKVFPELVSESSIDGMKGVNYTELIPVIIKAIQELNEKIK